MLQFDQAWTSPQEGKGNPSELTIQFSIKFALPAKKKGVPFNDLLVTAVASLKFKSQKL